LESFLTESSLQPALSVILPVRNEAPHVGAVLSQLAGQTLDPARYEVLVVDGASEDGTGGIVLAFAASHPNVRLLNNPRGLSSSARNIGAEHARSAYILFVDGHCQIESPRMLEAVLEAFERGERCVSRPQPLIAGEGDSFQMAVSLARSSWLGHNTGSKIYSDQALHCSPLSAGCGYQRALFLELEGIDEDFDAGEDLEFNLRVHRHGVTAYHANEFAVGYHPRDSFRALFRQLYRYGFGRARMALKHPRTFSPLAIGLALLGLWLFVLPLAGLVWPQVLGPWLLVSGGYALATGLLSAWLAKGRGLRMWLGVWSCFPAIHLGAGFGYLMGLVGGPSWCHAPRCPRTTPAHTG
jgi:prepilin-type processing-associated H-X9-DG protein